MRKRFIICILFLSLISSSRGYSQDFQLWSDFNFSAPLKGKLSLVGDIGLRGFITTEEWSAMYLRPGLRYNFTTILSINFSVANISTFNVNDKNVNELRFAGDIIVGWPETEYFSFTHRLRTERRYYFVERSPDRNAWRFRYLIGLKSLEIPAFREGSTIYGKIQFEPFRSVGELGEYELFMDETRIYAAFGHRLSQTWRYEIQYISQRSRVSPDDALKATSSIARIRIYHRFGLR